MKLNSQKGLISALAISVLLIGCGGTKTDEIKQVVTQKASTANSAASFQKIDVVVGDGSVATAGQTVSVHYTGWLYEPDASDNHGTKFDSSVDRGQPFQFPLGGGRVIKGWDQGVEGMKVGGKRTLIIPPEMGYGARGAGRVIPPNATLIFDVELLGVE
ncbi:FKBP-type peptidyl-prolyl cis-trans isomerase [Cocleimonas sp. KMM 6892]|uniref:FKBP-type peptidyl-prolyl cis-trans isomerase n=1 Tax=unclassified Cocleimonas TaxID=2639732 RepID=UPI002DBAF4F3|nr:MULTISPECIES: FKBP-type peptidyl-prolyl cis-trans isomerase [unclassified Cocleimonas]MEB8432967.1 FKBP-type peptidyl-prolyl cis-trans isomerase [Cocleimonas sp. KMM 6892]MEC4716052.1 FKBP-type peptidyl-prolyl cis-trans isomerase [Cocleimonas sp. KMM 6895]MEC4745513.1 FKBP-type peptidyl-prolyl cis-trans isomerase [Cocleimonas sp. KMM 6896]